MTGRFDLARLLAATTVARDDRGRVELRFAYPSSPAGQPALRRVRHPVLLHTRTGWVLRGRDDLRAGAYRAFDPARITTPSLDLAAAAVAAGEPARGGDASLRRRPHPPPREEPS